MKIINTLHPQKYHVRPGDGSAYSQIDFVVINKNSIKISITAPEAIKNNLEIEITDPEIISILPSLLNGEISCYEAMQKLETFLRSKHDKAFKYTSSFFHPETQSRVFNLTWDLLAKEDFTRLCQFFPHEHADRLTWLQNTPIKVVNDEIIQAIKENFSAIFYTEETSNVM